MKIFIVPIKPEERHRLINKAIVDLIRKNLYSFAGTNNVLAVFPSGNIPNELRQFGYELNGEICSLTLPLDIYSLSRFDSFGIFDKLEHLISLNSISIKNVIIPVPNFEMVCKHLNVFLGRGMIERKGKWASDVMYVLSDYEEGHPDGCFQHINLFSEYIRQMPDILFPRGYSCPSGMRIIEEITTSQDEYLNAYIDFEYKEIDYAEKVRREEEAIEKIKNISEYVSYSTKKAELTSGI